MTPREKASELIVNYQLKCKSLDYNEAKQCALIAVDEIFKVYELLDDDADIMFKTEINYWQEIKQEIEKL